MVKGQSACLSNDVYVTWAALITTADNTNLSLSAFLGASRRCMMYGQESFIFAVIHIGQRPVTVSSPLAPLRKRGISCATLSLMFINDKSCCQIQTELCGESVQVKDKVTDLVLVFKPEGQL